MTVQAAILEAVSTIMADATYDVDWEKRRARWRNASGHVLVTRLSQARKGVDEVRTSLVGSGGPVPVYNDLRERVYGVRVLRLQFTCVTDDQDLADSAHEIADRIIAGFSFHDVEAILDAADIGVPRCTEPRDISFFDDAGDERSAVVFEAAFNTSRTQTNPTLLPRVKAVEFSGELDDSDVLVGPTEVEP